MHSNPSLAPLYWHGNVAKTKVLRDLLARCSHDSPIVVFDYGCGSGGDWAKVLADYPNIRLVGYEPHAPSLEKARQRLAGCRAELFGGPSPDNLSFKADFIVSFSVFEHVYDREAYFRTARRLIADGGTFYLNYDDGHFRNLLQLGEPAEQWMPNVKEYIRNRSAGLLAAFGRIGKYQRRVAAAEAEALAASHGFTVERSEFSNLGSMKLLFRTIPVELHESYTSCWLALEDRLNREFLSQGDEQWGDRGNLWQVMYSKTLYLTANPGRST